MFATEYTTAQVVIRERVEVGAERRGEFPPDAGLNASPISGYYLYYPGGGSGSPYAVEAGETATLAGSATVTTTLGKVYTTDLSAAFTPSHLFTTYNCAASGEYSRWTHSHDPDAPMLRVPVEAGEAIESATVVILDSTYAFVSSFSPGYSGCKLDVSHDARCACFESTGESLKTASFSISREFEDPPPADTLGVTAAPDSLDLGETATITVIALDSLGSEVGLPDAEPMTITVSDTTWGLLSYQGSTGDQLVVPYSDARAGAVAFATDSTAVVTADTTVFITASGGGILGFGSVAIIPNSCPPGLGPCGGGSLSVSVDPNTLEYYEKGIVVVDAVNGSEIGVEDDTPLLLSLDEGGLKYAGFNSASAALSTSTTGTAQDLYSVLNEGTYALFYNRGRVPAADTTVTVTVEKVGDPTVQATTQVTLLACQMATCQAGQDQPQTVNTETDFPVVGKGDLFTWTGSDGTMQTAVVPDLYCDDDRDDLAGATGPAFNFKNGTYDVITTTYSTACRTSQGGVVPRIEDFELPVFSDTCQTGQFVADLGDLSYTKFMEIFPDTDPISVRKERYEQIRWDLKIWKIGPYTYKYICNLPDGHQQREAAEAVIRDREEADLEAVLYYSSVGIMIHENEHVVQQRLELQTFWNSLFNEVYDRRDEFICEHDAAFALASAIEVAIFERLRKIRQSREYPKEGELAADREATPFYEGLLLNLEKHRDTAGW